MGDPSLIRTKIATMIRSGEKPMSQAREKIISKALFRKGYIGGRDRLILDLIGLEQYLYNLD